MVGLSYSGAVALQLAADAPECVHSLCLIEPPPVHIPSADEFLAANQQLIEDHRLHGSATALDRFLTRVIGPDWRRDINDTFRTEWRRSNTMPTPSSPLIYRRCWPGISAPTTHGTLRSRFYLGGTASGPWFAQVRQLILAWLPHAEEVMLTGADHSMALTHAPQVATAIASFLRRHHITT